MREGRDCCVGCRDTVTILDAESMEERYVDAFVGNAGWWSCVFFLCLVQEGHELFDGRHGYISSVIPRKKSFALQIQEEDCRRHLSFDVRLSRWR